MGIFKSLGGMLTLELTSADTAGSLAAIANLGVPAFSVRSIDELTVRFQIPRSEYRKLKKHAAKKGETLRIIKKQGLYWDMKQMLRRPVLTLGILLMIALLSYIPKHVFFVRVEGNHTIPTREIIAAAEDCGIRFGASRREVRSEKMKNALLESLPELQWAGVNTYGCTAVISVSERAAADEEKQDNGICSITASRDGIILACTVRNGNSLCSIGQAVKEGQILISAYTDCGLCITATRAEGEIMALTSRKFSAITPAVYQNRGTIQAETAKYSLIIGKNRINFYKGSGISDATCGKMYSKYVLTLPGGFELPVMFIKETAVTYDHTAEEISDEAANVLLTDFSSRYLQQIMIAGSITNRSESVLKDGGVFCLTGTYACTEMIGRRQQAKIGELHEAD